VPFTLVHAGKYRTEDKLKTYTAKTKDNPEKANNTKHSRTKLTWFSHFLRHSTRKRGWLNLQCSRAHTGHLAHTEKSKHSEWTKWHEAKSGTDQTCELLKQWCNYRMLYNTTTREQFWQYSLLLLTVQIIAQMWSNAMWTRKAKWLGWWWAA